MRNWCKPEESKTDGVEIKQVQDFIKAALMADFPDEQIKALTARIHMQFKKAYSVQVVFPPEMVGRTDTMVSLLRAYATDHPRANSCTVYVSEQECPEDERARVSFKADALRAQACSHGQGQVYPPW